MNIIFFGNEKLKECIDNCWDNKDYVYYQINNYKNSKVATHIQGNINMELDSLVFVPYFLYSYYESEGNLELNNFIAKQIHSLPGKHIICMFTDLRCVDISSILHAYQGITNFLNKLEDNYIYLDKYNYISISRTTKNWINTLNNEINLTANNLINQTETSVPQKTNTKQQKVLK